MLGNKAGFLVKFTMRGGERSLVRLHVPTWQAPLVWRNGRIGRPELQENPAVPIEEGHHRDLT